MPFHSAPDSDIPVERRLFSYINGLLVAAAILLLYAPAAKIIVPQDHEGYENFMDEAESSRASGFEVQGKLWVGWFYASIERVLPVAAVTMSAFIFYHWCVISHLVCVRHRLVLIGVFIIVSFQMFIWSLYISKEGILFMIIAGSLVALHLRVPFFLVRLLAFSSLVVFCLFVRPYYIPILILASSAFAVGYRWTFIGVLMSLPFIFSFGTSVAEKFNEIRLQMWTMNTYKHLTRSVMDFEWFRSEPWREFLTNYALCVGQIVFPFWSHFSIKECFLVIFNLCVVVTVVYALKYGDRFFAMFGIGIMLILPAFVVDFGAYTRHTGCAVMFMYLSIVWRAMQHSRAQANQNSVEMNTG